MVEKNKNERSTEKDEENWKKLVKDLAEGRLSILQIIRGTGPILAPEGDFLGHVTLTRACMMLMQDPRILERLSKELDNEFSQVVGYSHNMSASRRHFKSKDGSRLFGKLASINAEMYGDGPSLLQPGTFEECLAQYFRLIGRVEAIWDKACRNFSEGQFPLCTFLSILAMEEVGKLGRLWFDLLSWDRPSTTARKSLGRLGRDHHKKHFMGVIPGAVINTRLDRILGQKRIKALLQDVESGKLERLRQSCLYIDIVDEKVIIPDDVISQEMAEFYVVLAGELWAEILGQFPWEFERMIAKVISFEILIGMDEKLVARS